MKHLERHIINNEGTLQVILITNRNAEVPVGATVKHLDDQHVRYTLTGPNALDFLLHDPESLSVVDKMNLYTKGHVGIPFHYVLTDPNGVAPSRARPSDSGFDLTLIAERKRYGNVVLYGTGVAVQPPNGFYFDMVPRSSIIKQGYMLANSVGIIDQAYTGEIMVPLIKVDPNAPDLVLPTKLVQLIPRKWYGLTPCLTDKLISTERAEGGFGSTNNARTTNLE
jgi:deoxyuridine 5'-triphosphate nucleotidohydrolase